ncbi:actin-binding protein IPP-like isoform X1 [Drosophila santomea]|uniref:actin-binding protein IPP-like isoform X1 n=1 Tax=Drosophila santomea TaxID=129105 RepID=UPI0019549796|nr:actin-binding protein IPP-like isoform X1 [Drosophila santomea]
MAEMKQANKLAQTWKGGKMDQAEIDALAADLAAAISSSYMTARRGEIVSGKRILESSSEDKQLLLSKKEIITNPSSKTDIKSSEKSETVEPEPLNSAFSMMPTTSPSGEILNCRQPAKVPMDAKLLRLLIDPACCSFTVYVGNYKFRCHLQVLQAHSRFFQDLPDAAVTANLASDMVTPTAFHVIYNWMLDLERCPQADCFLVELYSAAFYLKIDELVEYAFACFNESTVCGSLAFELFREAQRFAIHTFQQLMLSRIELFFLPLVASKDFVELDINWVQDLLSVQSLGVNSEIEIFMSAVRWLSHDWSGRKVHMERIMGCVRFRLLPPLFLRFLQGEQQTRVMNSICQSPKVRERVSKAFVRYTSSELCDLSKDVVGLSKDRRPPVQRKWICDSRCSYHRQPGGNQGQFFTYQQFLNYLESLHQSLPKHGS